MISMKVCFCLVYLGSALYCFQVLEACVRIVSLAKIVKEYSHLIGSFQYNMKNDVLLLLFGSREKCSNIMVKLFNSFQMFFHVSKNICEKMWKAAKKKSISILSKWIKSICKHFWCSWVTCGGCENLFREKWTSILFHIKKHN